MCDVRDRSQTSAGPPHEEPGRSIFEGHVLKIEHDWGGDYDMQAGGWDGQPPDTWLSEHVLRRFEGKHVRVTVEVLGDGAGDA